MRLLADENVPLDTVRALRSAGHDVYSATEGGPGASDLSHVARAVREDRLIVTRLLTDLLACPDVTWRGNLSVVDQRRLRQRPI